MKKTKKQHYVPRCYLENFAISDTYQINVYDKQLRKSRINSIKDVASENYFYDFKLSGALNDDTIKNLNDIGISIEAIDNEQYLEKYFAEIIESAFSGLLKEIISKVKSATSWYMNNCFFISESQKLDLSVCLAVQYIRTKTIREGLFETSDCMLQMLDDMNANQELKDSMKLSKEEAKLIHGKMIFDTKNLLDLVAAFNSLSWILGINKTSKRFYTSDNPIGTKAHISHPFLSMSGPNSTGVEAFFPISPEIILVMYDGEYHKVVASKDRTFGTILEDNVDYYNSLMVMRSNRCIYSNINDFSLIDKMVKRDPHILENNNTTELHWGGNTYTPRK